MRFLFVVVTSLLLHFRPRISYRLFVVFAIVEDVCGHLLSPMPINNSQEVFKFVLHAYIREPHTHSQTFALLSTLLDPAIMRRDVLGQYYVGTFSHIWLKALDVRPQVNRCVTR